MKLLIAIFLAMFAIWFPFAAWDHFIPTPVWVNGVQVNYEWWHFPCGLTIVLIAIAALSGAVHISFKHSNP